MEPDKDLAKQVISGEKRLLTAQEVSDRLGVSLYVLRQWRGRGDGPRFLTLGGRTIRYPETALVTYITEGMSPVGGEEDGVEEGLCDTQE